MFDHQIILVLAHYLIVSYYPCVASLSCRRRTRATRCVTPIPFYTKIDAQCDKLATVELSWQRLRRSMCSGKIVQLRGKVLQYWIHCHFELPATSYRRICLLLSATLKIFIMLNDINHEFCHFHFVAHSNNEDKAETGWKLCIHRKNKQDQIYSLYSSEICTATRAQYTAQCPQSYAVANAWWISWHLKHKHLRLVQHKTWKIFTTFATLCVP